MAQHPPSGAGAASPPPSASAGTGSGVWWRRLAGSLAGSPLFHRGRRLFEANCKDWNMPMSKLEKLWAGLYLILADTGTGRFPPTFADQARVHQAERDYMETMPGCTLSANLEAHMRKPFWGAQQFGTYSHNFTRLLRIFEAVGLQRGSRLLELGCGSGWMTEFLAQSGYAVVGTTISPHDIDICNKRVASLRVKGLEDPLSFLLSPMETVDQAVAGQPPFDGVFVFEAIHHAFDWRQTIQACFRVLKPGGWLVLASEPNVLQTLISYRFARINNTHELGLSQRELLDAMHAAGFVETRVFAPRWNNRVSTHWIAARR
jgi:2-polyprenyl-3-methyl-5-hydroxy-6-metoxy-1,4-benzoquinol methylase